MFFLINEDSIIEVSKLKINIINMILRFCKKELINSITILEQFDTSLSVGKYLVQTDKEGMEYSVYLITDTGYLREYKQAVALSKIKIVNFIPVEIGLTDEEKNQPTNTVDLRMQFSQ
jgi:hypothetical protein